jgi:hypothetical protein
MSNEKMETRDHFYRVSWQVDGVWHEVLCNDEATIDWLAVRLGRVAVNPPMPGYEVGEYEDGECPF